MRFALQSKFSFLTFFIIFSSLSSAYAQEPEVDFVSIDGKVLVGTISGNVFTSCPPAKKQLPYDRKKDHSLGPTTCDGELHINATVLQASRNMIKVQDWNTGDSWLIHTAPGSTVPGDLQIGGKQVELEIKAMPTSVELQSVRDLGKPGTAPPG